VRGSGGSVCPSRSAGRRSADHFAVKPRSSALQTTLQTPPSCCRRPSGIRRYSVTDSSVGLPRLVWTHHLTGSRAPFADALRCHDPPVRDIGVVSVISAAGFCRGPRLSAPAGGAILAGLQVMDNAKPLPRSRSRLGAWPLAWLAPRQPCPRLRRRRGQEGTRQDKGRPDGQQDCTQGRPGQYRGRPLVFRTSSDANND